MTGDEDDLFGQIDWECVARAETFPLRLSILELLAMDGGRALSPKEMADELQEPLSTINHHIASLRESELIQLVHEHQAGGAIDHLYCLSGCSACDLAERLKQWRESRGLIESA